jgi:hypothetical protein
MYSVRKVRTKSGSVAIQVVRYVGHRSIIAKHIGSAKDQTEEAVLRQRALDWIDDKLPSYRCFLPKNKSFWLLTGASASG